jgi:hypothetical protein
MAVRLVQTKSTAKTVGSGSSTNVWSANTTTGNFIVVMIICDSLTANPVSTVADSQSNTYNKIFSTTTNGVIYCTVDVWVAYNITGGTTPTITATLGASQITGMIAREYAGIPTTAVVDRSVSTSITVASLRMPSAPTSITTSPYELAIAVVGDGNGANTFNPANGFVNGVSLDIGSTFGCGMADKILTGLVTENADFNATPNTTQGVVGLITIPAIKDNISVTKTRPYPFSPGMAR